MEKISMFPGQHTVNFYAMPIQHNKLGDHFFKADNKTIVCKSQNYIYMYMCECMYVYVCMYILLQFLSSGFCLELCMCVFS